MKYLASLLFIVFSNFLVFAASPIDVHVSLGKVSEVVFPEKVAKVIKGGVGDSVLVEVLDNTVYLLPKTDAPADVFVTGVSAQSYPLNLVVSPQHDIRVEVNGQSARRISQDIKQGALDLMKAILLGHEPAGATVLKGGQSVILSNQDIKFTVNMIYDFPHLAAYVFKAKNLTDNSVVVPVEQVSFPHLLAITADEDVLRPQGQEGDTTQVYLVAEK